MPTSLRSLVALALAMGVATVLVAWADHLPLRDPDDSFGHSWVRLPVILILAVLVDALPRIVWRWRSGQASLTTVTREVFVERWPHEQIRFTLIGLVSWYVTYSAFRDLKSFVPFVNDSLWDNRLASIDKVVFLGNHPAVVLHHLFGTSWAAVFFSGVYLLWIGLIPATLAWALTWTRNRAVAAWYATALALDWVIGVTLYFLVPTLGPFYSRAQDFAGLPHSATWLQTSMMDDRINVVMDPRGTETLQTIAAFPSLHVGMMVTICLVVQWNTRHRIARALCWGMLVLTCLATLYLGWHFFTDLVGGAVVGATAAWLGAYASGLRGPRLFSPDRDKNVPA